MKYFIQFTEETNNNSPINQGAKFELLEASRPYFENLKKAGRVLDWGYFGIGHGLYAVCDIRNHAELHEVTELVPARPFCRIECRPVLESGEFADVIAKVKRESLPNYDKLARR